ncbi:unnamed protein product, partial [Polarella glacialis]
MAGPEDSVPCEDFATCGAAQFQNRQYAKNVKQQDSYFVVEDIGATFGAHLGNVQRVALYGVADGHGEFGEVSANFIRRHLPPLVAQSPNFSAGRLVEALLDAFAQTELLQQSAGLPLWASGACVTAALVSPTHIFVANCGDCRAVVSEQLVARDLSSDHNVENALSEEIRRVLSAGGTITPDKRVTIPGAPGRLATTRSLGDYWAKPQGPPEGHVVSALPEVRTISRHPGQKYLILASDGIFGFMSSQDVLNLCHQAASQAPQSAPLSHLANSVVCTAVQEKQSDDNATCVIVDLARVASHNSEGFGNQSLTLPPPVLSQHRSLQASARGGYGYSGRDREQDSREIRRPVTTYDTRPEVTIDHRFSRERPGGLMDASWPRKEAAGGNIESDNTSVPSSSLAGPDEVCWCPWCWGMNQDGEPENAVVGSFERWRLHMHEQHFDKLGSAYGVDDIVPCYWCCKPCVTKKGQSKGSNRLPFWGSHERVCKENPSKPGLPAQARSSEGSQSSGDRWGAVRPRQVPPHPQHRNECCGSDSGRGVSPNGLRYRDLRDLRDLR